jgi:hypothetical protein
VALTISLCLISAMAGAAIAWVWLHRPRLPREIDVDEQRAIDEAEAAHRERVRRIESVAEVRRVLEEARRSREE